MRNHTLPLLLVLAPLSNAQDTVVPNNAPTQAGNGGYSTLLNSGERSYQLVVGPEELGGLPIGASVTGIAWRRPTWISFGDWPGAGFTCSWTNYDIFLSSSNNPPGSLSTTYTDNIGSDVVQVRSGPLSLTDAYFPGGAVTPAVNPFGTTVQFQTPYVYQGGDLLLTIRHTGNNCGGNGSLDTVGSPFSQAIGQSSYTDPDNWYNQGLITMKLEFDPPADSSLCNGDGGDQMGCTDCPCGNNAPAGTIGGCINSAGTSTRLLRSGSASVAAADLRFEGSGAPAAASAVLTSGNSLAPANAANPCFGLNSGISSVNLDGLRCAVQGVLRHGVRPTDLNGEIGVLTNGWGTPNGFFQFSVFTAGSTKHFQIIHRDTESAVCQTGQNSSQAQSVTFTP